MESLLDTGVHDGDKEEERMVVVVRVMDMSAE